MVKSIQVFKYDYAPTKAELRQKIGNKKTISRPIINLYKENNVKNLTFLKTIIKDLDENNEDGTQGIIDHQFFRRLETGGGGYTYEDNWQQFSFFISSKYNIIIIGGGSDKIRLDALHILVGYLSNDISFLSAIYIKTQPMLKLVNKIKQEGPMNSSEYKNIMTDAVWKFLKKDSHEGAKRDETNMHRDENDPHCLSKYSTFDKNMEDSDAFDTTMSINRVNGILNPESYKAYYLSMYENSRFVFTTDPAFHQWIIFILQTCKRALGIRAQNTD